MSETQYRGPERRRRPRDNQHSFATVFLKTDTGWQAREALVLDRNTMAFRVRTLPNLANCQFLFRFDDQDSVLTAEILRSEQFGDYWEFTLKPGQRIPEADALCGVVTYDFPRELHAPV